MYAEIYVRDCARKRVERPHPCQSVMTVLYNDNLLKFNNKLCAAKGKKRVLLPIMLASDAFQEFSFSGKAMNMHTQ